MSPHDTLMTDAIRDPLPGLRKQLANEFGRFLPKKRINDAAEQALDEFEGARIREFVPVFAWRHARARLSDVVRVAATAPPTRAPSRSVRRSPAPSPLASAGTRP